jgi:hypothetical protein
LVLLVNLGLYFSFNSKSSLPPSTDELLLPYRTSHSAALRSCSGGQILVGPCWQPQGVMTVLTVAVLTVLTVLTVPREVLLGPCWQSQG